MFVSRVVIGAGLTMVSVFLRFSRFDIFWVCCALSSHELCFYASRLLSSFAVGHTARLTLLPLRLSVACFLRSLSIVFALLETSGNVRRVFVFLSCVLFRSFSPSLKRPAKILVAFSCYLFAFSFDDCFRPLIRDRRKCS